MQTMAGEARASGALVELIEMVHEPPHRSDLAPPSRLTAESAVATWPMAMLDTFIWARVGAHRVAGPYERWGKPMFDRVVAALLLLVALPVIVVALLLIHPQIGQGGALFRQARIGRDGKPFTLYKLRTMRPDRRTSGAAFYGPDRRSTHKSLTDPRHTPRGSVLRRVGLDEVPQLWNVLRGEMSLVGPRPELVGIVHDHGLLDHPRHRVKPGLTGPWQISADRARPIREGLGHDLGYLLNISLWSDLVVLVRTVRVMAAGSGA